MSIEKLNELPGLKEEHIELLADMNIESLADMSEALEDEETVKDIMGMLKGVGPKTVEKWRDALADAVIIEEEEEDEEPEDVEIVDEEEAEEGVHVAKAKPELDDAVRARLSLRSRLSANRPAFKRQEWFRYSKLGDKWRRPKGIHSKMRRGFKHRPPRVKVGFRGPKDVRGLHPSGFAEVLVHNTSQLEGVDPKVQAVRIASTVGVKKRIDIEDMAEELGIRVLNRMG